MYVCSARGWRTENSPPPPPQLDYKPYGSNYSLMMAELQEAQKPMEIGALWGPFMGPCGVPFWSLVGEGVPLDLWTKGPIYHPSMNSKITVSFWGQAPPKNK
jgi:hypothetical protein